MKVDRALERVVWVLAIGGGVVYVAAKVDFFTRFDPRDMAGYWAEHWPYTAALATISAAIWAVVRLLARSGSGARSEGVDRRSDEWRA